MALFRPSRERRGPDPYYHWKAVLFSLGGGIGLLAMFSGRDWLIWPAVAILAGGVSLRWFGNRDAPQGPDEEDDGGAAEPPPAEPPEVPPHEDDPPSS